MTPTTSNAILTYKQAIQLLRDYQDVRDATTPQDIRKRRLRLLRLIIGRRYDILIAAERYYAGPQNPIIMGAQITHPAPPSRLPGARRRINEDDLQLLTDNAILTHNPEGAPYPGGGPTWAFNTDPETLNRANALITDILTS
jgi:hypothetical protein